MKRLLLLTTVLLASFWSLAATITVTNNGDANAGSLRQASIDANSGDTIRFDPNLISFGNSTITLTSGEINFGNKAIVIKGLYTATDTLFISGNNSSRIFSFTSAGKVVLDSLVLINGNGAGAISSGSGGAVFYYNGIDTLHVKNSIISGNTAAGNGGGVYVEGTTPSANFALIVANSTISGNTASSDGGGIACFANPGGLFISVINSTISENAAAKGGGIYSSGSVITLNIKNSTIVKNTATTEGGGIRIEAWGWNSNLNVTNSTISENAAASGAGINSLGSISLQQKVGSSIIAENGSGSSGFYNNAFSSLGYNVFSDNPFFGGSGSGDQINITAAQLNLSPLQNNGGTTKTMLPGVGSVAIDMGNPADNSTAQNGPLSGIRDAGAAEYSCESFSSISETACNSYTSPSGKIWTISNTYSDTIPNAALCDSVITINLTINVQNQSVNATSSTLCASNTGTTITTALSETGINYYLRDDANDTIVDGPITGTGTGLSFNTGVLDNSMSYNVNAEEANPVTSNFSLNFEGGTEQVTVPNDAMFEFSTGTIECWLKPGVSSNSQAFVSMRSNGAVSRFSLHINENSNHILIYASAHGVGAIPVAGGIDPDTWYHVAIVMKNSGSDIYVNGVLQGSLLQRIDVGLLGKDFVIGSANDPTYLQEAFTGDIDEVRVWDVERTAVEILANYSNCLKGPESGLVAYYNFEDGTSSFTLSDLSSNGFNGTLNTIDPFNSYVANAPITCLSCDLEMSSIVTVTVSPVLSGVNNTTICATESVVINGTTYNAATPTGTEIFTVGVNSCDSTVTVSLNVLTAIDITVTNTAPTLTANQTGAIYRWLDCNNGNAVISGENSQTFTATANGDYAVEITVGNCVDTSACVNITSVGVKENFLFNAVNIYPNPNKGLVNINLGDLKEVIVKVFNTQGQIVHQKTNINTPTYQFEITEAKGIYFIELNADGKTKRFKVIKD